MTTPLAMNDLFGGQSADGFLGIPQARLGTTNHAQLVILGIPTATPYPSVGPYCAEGPSTIRKAMGWPNILKHHDFDIGGAVLPNGISAVDWGDLGYGEDAASNRRNITSTIESILDSDAVPIVLGGDDSIVTPVLQAYAQHGPITVLQIDAHIDWRDEVNGERWGLSSTMRRASEMGWIEEIILVGARSIGSAYTTDFEEALSTGAQFFPMHEFRHKGIRQGIEDVIDALPASAKLFITLDVDGLDPSIMPAVIGPAPGGLDYWDLVDLVEGVVNKADSVVGFDIVELMPRADIGGQGARLAARIVATMMGHIARSLG